MERFRLNPQAASKVAATGIYPRPNNLNDVELATWTALANTLLNLDETITRE